MVQRQADQQPRYLSRYLSLAPVLAILAVSIAFSTWAFYQWFFPDLLLHPMP
jgi:photosystem I subunit IX